MQRRSKHAASLVLFGPLLASCQSQEVSKAKENPVIVEIVRSTGQQVPPVVPYSALTLRDVSDSGEKRTVAAESGAYSRIFGSAAQNGRSASLSAPTPGRTWSVKWQFALAAPASAVLCANDRVLAQTSNGWTLGELISGRRIASGVSSRAMMSLDPGVGMFYGLGAGNMLEAMALDSGELRFVIPVGYDEAFVWPLIHRSGKNLVISGFEQPQLSPRVEVPRRSLFQVVQVGSPVKLSPYKVLLSLDLQRDLIFRTASMIPVASGSTLWALMPDLVIRTSPSQEIDGAWSGSFTPLAASADESGWLYALVALTDRRELWAITPEGVRRFRSEVPTTFPDTKMPPVIGYDHRVYLYASQDVLAMSPKGEKLWELHLAGGIAGVTVTPGGALVVAAGGAVYQVNGLGKAEALVTGLSKLTTPPVVTAQGEILVGTETGVVCLTAQ